MAYRQDQFLMRTLYPDYCTSDFIKKGLGAKLTILPVYRICLSNVNTIHDQRLTSLHLHSAEDCYFGVENISLIRMLNNPRSTYIMCYYLSVLSSSISKGEKQNNINQVSIILMTAVL